MDQREPVPASVELRPSQSIYVEQVFRYGVTEDFV
jgi:hypothetical protein